MQDKERLIHIDKGSEKGDTGYAMTNIKSQLEIKIDDIATKVTVLYMNENTYEKVQELPNFNLIPYDKDDNEGAHLVGTYKGVPIIVTLHDELLVDDQIIGFSRGKDAPSQEPVLIPLPHIFGVEMGGYENED